MKNQTMSSETGYGMTDYSRKTSWYQIPDAAREVDTIYIYATEYIMGSFEEGSPDYATLDNEEMLQGVACYQRVCAVLSPGWLAVRGGNP